MDRSFLEKLQTQTSLLKQEGLYKEERVITSQQDAMIFTQEGKQVINLCANNYLGLANHPRLIQAAKEGLDRLGYGLASVRFICGTQTIHKQLEAQLSAFLQTEDTILYSSCFDANGGLFETLLGPNDAVFSDELNHASVIDGIRLCKAQRFRYANNDKQGLEEKLKEAQSCERKLIVTDGVFSMDGVIVDLKSICDLADKYEAMVMVDDSHAVGFLGDMGRGSHEYCHVIDRVDIITGTLGKALGGASGGYTSGRKEIIQWLRQRSRPYLFSNTLTPCIAFASLEVLRIIQENSDLRDKLRENTEYFRKNMETLGFDLAGKDHPIIPVMMYDAKLASQFATRMLDEGIYVISFSYPVVPKEKARIRTQISAALTKNCLDKALNAFEKVGKELGLI